MINENFGFEETTKGEETLVQAEEKTNLDTGVVGHEDKTNLDDDNNGNGGSEAEKGEGGKAPSSTGGEETQELTAGTTVEIDGTAYTINEAGDLVDEKGEVFKTKAELPDYLKQFEETAEDEVTEINVSDIQKLVGIDVVDDKGTAVQFENTPQGVAEYVNSVLELKRNEFAQAGINKLIEDYPIVNDFLNYYIANGGSYEGFGEMKDRSGIVVDDTNEAQQEAIVREAWKEFGKRGDVNKYIAYLKDSGQLLDCAKDDLAALQQADAEIREQTSKEAAQRQAEYEQEVTNYWKNVKATIDKREIAGYKIPDTVIINKNGKQISVTPDDFFDYIYQIDDKGLSRYQKELAQETPQQRMGDELLKAWLKYTGKSYDSLVEMAVAQKEVKKLRLTANKNKTAKATIKITKAANKGGNLNNENFGY